MAERFGTTDLEDKRMINQFGLRGETDMNKNNSEEKKSKIFSKLQNKI